MKIGRNDPCPCNSGKKYKKCCLGKETKSVEAEQWFQGEAPLSAWDVAGTMSEGGARPSVEPISSSLVKRLEDTYEFEARRPEIEAAHKKLNAHREAYERLTEDIGEIIQRADLLFAEPAFNDIYFTVDELERTFDQIGYPPTAGSGERFIRYVTKAVNTMLGEKERAVLAHRLFCHMPEYVEAGRYFDAWILQHNAIQLCEMREDECCPFLLCIFMTAMQKWQEMREREQDELFDKIGVDPDELQKLNDEEIDALLDSIEGHTRIGAEVEEFLEKHPKLKAQVETDCQESEAVAVDFLHRDEALPLLLETEEILPWLPVLEERLTANNVVLDAIQGEAPLSENDQDALMDIIYQLSSEMAGEIFTEERLQQLSKNIEGCRRCLAPDDRDGLAGLNGVRIACRTSPDPAENYVLIMLCLVSMKRIVQSSLGKTPNAESSAS